MTMTDTSAPNTIPWPPIFLVGAFIAGFLLEAAIGSHIGLPQGLGWFIVVLAILLDGWAMITMFGARTNVLPNRGADKLVTHGPFAWTRNPIYLGNTLLLIGIGIAFSSVLVMLMAVWMVYALHHFAILREEAHMKARFGSAYEVYMAETPRWIGFRGSR